MAQRRLAVPQQTEDLPTLRAAFTAPHCTPAAVTGFTAKATNGAVTIVPAPLLWTSAAGRIAIAFPASSFADQPAGAYIFTAAAVNADGTGSQCNPGAQFNIV